MRQGYKNGWLLNESNGDLIGVNLGSDFVAEHEWGMERLQSLLGTPSFKQLDDEVDYNGLYGIERRRCKLTDNSCVYLKEEGDVLSFAVLDSYRMKYFLDKGYKVLCREFVFSDETDMLTAWDSESCAISVKGEPNFKKLRILYHELMAGNVAVWLGGGGVFQNAGLCFAIIDKIPQDSLQTMKNADIDKEKLLKAAKQTGIKKKIIEANEQWRKMREVSSNSRCYDNKWGFYALSPRWIHPQEKKQSKHPVVFWLNPMEQDKNNYGWYTVEELEQWLLNTGPIPKSARESLSSQN